MAALCSNRLPQVAIVAEMLAPVRLELIPHLPVRGLTRLAELRLAGSEESLPLLPVALGQQILLGLVLNGGFGERVVEAPAPAPA